MTNRKKVCLCLLFAGCCAALHAQYRMPSWYLHDNAPIMETVRDQLTDIEVYGWIRQEAVKTWGEKVFSVEVAGSPLKYHWFDLDTYCLGDSEGMLPIIIQWYLAKFGRRTDYDDMSVSNPNTGLAPDIKTSMKLTDSTLCFTITADSDGELLIVNRYFPNTETYATFVSPIYKK